MPIYTKKGDLGFSSTISAKNLAKSSEVFEVLGSLDELNSYIGYFLSSFELDLKIKNYLTKLQTTLINLSSFVAGGDNQNILLALVEETKEVEKLIDLIESKNQKLTNFIIPGGTKEASFCHILRTLTRKVERRLLLVTFEEALLSFINRLSDLFFVLARALNDNGKKDIILK